MWHLRNQQPLQAHFIWAKTWFYFYLFGHFLVFKGTRLAFTQEQSWQRSWLLADSLKRKQRHTQQTVPATEEVLISWVIFPSTICSEIINHVSIYTKIIRSQS